MRLVAACGLRGDVETLSDLLAAGEPLEARCEEGFTALYTAAAEDDPDAVRCLIEAGAVVSVGGSPQGATPLMVASENGHLECVRMLIEAGADLDMHVSCELSQTLIHPPRTIHPPSGSRRHSSSRPETATKSACAC